MNILLLGPLWRNAPIRDFLVAKGNNVECTSDPIDLELTQRLKIEFILSSGYGPIIKPPVVRAFPEKILNLHATYLPYGKGIGTTFFAIFEGVPTGVSIHFIDESIDTGAVLKRKKVEYKKTDTLRTFYDVLLKETEALFFDSWEEIISGECKPLPQSTFNISVPYRSRIDSERFMDLLPLKWDTPLSTVEAMGAEFRFSEAFWDLYEEEAAR
jgi:methionyl-tRNA formyltransferase